MKLVAYTRTSTARQDLGLDVQKAQIEAYCSLYGHSVVSWHEDQASGSSTARDGLQAAIEVPCDGLIVAKLDRLTRSVADLYRLLDVVPAFISVSEQLDTSCASGRLVLGVLGVVAQWEREVIAERTSAALQAKKASGKRWTCHAPYGYEWRDGLLVELRSEQNTAHLMQHWRAHGCSWSDIAGRLVSKTRSGKAWSRSTAWKAYKSWEGMQNGND